MSAPARKPITRHDGEESPLVKFAAEVGSTKGLDPIPPDQYLTYQDPQYDPDIRLWAWMHAHTIRHRHRSAIAVDVDGKPLTLKQASADLRMDQGNTRKAWRKLESENRVRKCGPQENLRLCGDIPKAIKLPNSGESRKIGGEVYIDLIAPYIQKQLASLPALVRDRVITSYKQETTLERRYLAGSAMSIRNIFSDRKDTILQEAGVKLLRSDKPPKPPTPEEKQFRHLIGYPLERSVQSSLDRGLYTAQNGTIQTSPDLVQNGFHPLALDTSKHREKSTPVSSSPEIFKKDQSSSSAVKAEDEDSCSSEWKVFEALYPAAHFDPSKAKAVFEKKSKPARMAVIEHLGVYLHSERWKSDNGRWIPLASNWLKDDSYKQPPPPALESRQTNGTPKPTQPDYIARGERILAKSKAPVA